MPLLDSLSTQIEDSVSLHRRISTSFFRDCANWECQGTKRSRLRGRNSIAFESSWACSEDCMQQLVLAALRRELQDRDKEPAINAKGKHRHRMPLGLLMVENGWITASQLRQSLSMQKEMGRGRLGEWLTAQHGVDESLITRALSLQWNCPVLKVENYQPDRVSSLIPRILIDSYVMLPMRVAANKILYLGFEDRIDPCVSLAIERMTGLSVESGVVSQNSFHLAHRRMLSTSFPPSRLIEASNLESLSHALTRLIEKLKPVQAKLVRMHDCLWLRMWKEPSAAIPRRDQIEDVLCWVDKKN